MIGAPARRRSGSAVDGPFGQLVSVVVQALVYVGLIRLLVVDTARSTWRGDGRRAGSIGGPSARWLGGALWAIPVIVVTVPIVASSCSRSSRSRPTSPLPPTGETAGFVLSARSPGAIVAPFGEELLFRGFATTAWVRGAGRPPRASSGRPSSSPSPTSSTSSAATAGEAIGLALVGFATGSRSPSRSAGCSSGAGRSGRRSACTRRSTAILLILGEVAIRSV